MSSDDNTHSTLGVNGGSETKTISVNNLPSFSSSVSTDTANLTGSFTARRTNDDHAVVGNAKGIAQWWRGDVNQTVDYRSAEQLMDRIVIDASHSHSGTATFTGQNQALNIMPPYVVVNMWKRLTLATVETVTSV